jgi:outer membrane protein OmpA-like peptidoglycan-associated protein
VNHSNMSILRVLGVAFIASVALTATSLEAEGLRHQTINASASVEALENYRLVKLKRVYFAPGKAHLSSEDEISLGQLVSRFRRTNQFVIELRGYADGAGSTDQDLALSTKRAEAIAQYLTANGIFLQRIRIVGLGEIDETGPKDNPGHQRVDIRIFMNPTTTANVR